MASDHDRDAQRDRLLMRFVSRVASGAEVHAVTDDEVEYFRAHPEEIDDFAAPIAIHRVFLYGGVGVGAVTAVSARAIEATGALGALSPFVERIIVDLAFGVGVALISASITAFMLGTLMNQQQRSAHRWRADLHARIAEAEAAEEAVAHRELPG